MRTIGTLECLLMTKIWIDRFWSLVSAGAVNIFKEKMFGKSMTDHEELRAALDFLREKDTFIIEFARLIGKKKRHYEGRPVEHSADVKNPRDGNIYYVMVKKVR